MDGRLSLSKFSIDGHRLHQGNAPQGTVLGLLLFLAYINDIPEGIQSTVKLVKDDSLVYRKIGNKTDCEILKQDLDRLQEWEKKWQMAFNAEKCEVLCITNKINSIQHNYFIHGQKLATKSDSKYLGVTISSNLSWSKHVNNISKKANSNMTFLRLNIRQASQQAKSTAYKTFIRPTLEYASTVWSPHTNTDSNQHGTEKSCQICPECLQPQKQCYSHASGPRLGDLAAMQRPCSPVYDVRDSSPKGRHPRRTVPDTS